MPALVSSTVSSVAPKLITELPGPNARRVLAGDQRWISPSYTRGYPLVARRGRGLRVEDVDGNEFLDFSAGIAVCSTGHCHPEVVAAIQYQAGELLHMSGTDFYYEHMVQVAEQLEPLAPFAGPIKVFYGNSGAEAVEAAIKLARYHTRRPFVVGFYNSFHGRTMGALSLTSSKITQRARLGALLPGFFHIPYPDPYRPLHGAVDTAAACLEDLDRLFHTTTPPGEVAAIVMEAVQGEGGYVVPPSGFVQEIRRLCTQHGILLVVDEVQAGCGRTGKMWAIEHHQVEPDIVCSAKGIASGMPLGVMFSRAELMDWTPGAHASTFGGNPVALAAAEVTLRLLQGGLIQNSAEVGAYLMQRLQTWPSKFPNVGQVRGLGLMIGIELVEDQKSRKRAPELRDRIVDAAFYKGLLVLGCGQNTLRLMPPLVCSKPEADVALDILEACLREQSATPKA